MATEAKIRGGIRAAEKNLARDPDYYRKIGAKGGRAKVKKGFAMMDKDELRELGRRANRMRWEKNA